MKVRVSRQETSRGLKSTEKGSSRLPEMLVNNIYFCWKERAALQSGEVLKSGILGEEGAQLLPGRLGLNVGEVELGELSATIKPSRPPLRGGGPSGLNGVGMRIGM